MAVEKTKLMQRMVLFFSTAMPVLSLGGHDQIFLARPFVRGHKKKVPAHRFFPMACRRRPSTGGIVGRPCGRMGLLCAFDLEPDLGPGFVRWVQ
jgi:hypothetical protein